MLCRGDRDKRERILERALKEFGIQTRPFYVPLHRLPLYARDQRLPNAEFLGDHGFLVPTYSGLTDAEVDEISESLKTCITEKK